MDLVIRILLWLLYVAFVMMQSIVVIGLFQRNIPATVFVLIGHIAVSWLLLGFVRFKIQALRLKFHVDRIPHMLNVSAPPVTLMIPVCNEPVDVLAETFKAVKEIDWPALQVIIIENSTCLKTKTATVKLASKYNLPIYHVRNRGTKAAALNDSLSIAQGEFLLLLDADIVPVPEILRILATELMNDEKLSFVQAPQTERNANESFVTIGTVAQQIHFYEHFCEGFGRGERALCVGTNCLFRAAAVRAVGGWPESTVTEDVAISYRLHKAGFKSVYINYNVGQGLAPVTLRSYFNQRSRYAEGGFLLLREVAANLFSNWKNRLSINTWQIDYLFAFSFYFISIAYFAYWVAIPVFWATNQYSQSPGQESVLELTASALAFVCIQLILVIDMPRRGYSMKKLLIGQGMAILGAPAYLIGIVNSFRRKQIRFVITKKKSGTVSQAKPKAILYIFTGLCLGFALSLIALVWHHGLVGLSGAFWLAVNATLLSLPGLLTSS